MAKILVAQVGSPLWAELQSIACDRVVESLDPLSVGPGDVVIGDLPTSQVVRLCERGARYQHLAIEPDDGNAGGSRPQTRLVELRATEAAAAPPLRPSPAQDASRAIVVVATGQNVANLPPILHVARPGDEVFWLCSNTKLREKAEWAGPVLRELKFESTVIAADCPTLATAIPPWIERHLMPRLRNRRVVLIGNGGTKLMSRAVEQALEGVLDETVYSDGAAPSLVRSSSDRRRGTWIEPCSKRIRLAHLLAFSDHQALGDDQGGTLLWCEGSRTAQGSALSAQPRVLDLDEVAQAWRQLEHGRRRERIDPTQISLPDVLTLAHDHQQVRGALETWRQAFWKSVDRALVYGSVAAVEDALANDPPDLPRRKRGLPALRGAAISVNHARKTGLAWCSKANASQMSRATANEKRGLLLAALRRLAEHCHADTVQIQAFQQELFAHTTKLIRAAERALLQGENAPQPLPLGPKLELAVAARVLDWLEAHPQWAATVSEVWHGVRIVRRSEPWRVVAEHDVLLVLKNALLVNIECKAGTVDRKDLDARVEVQRQASSSLASLWLCSIMPTARAHEPWFRAAHEVRMSVLNGGDIRHLPYTWPDQPSAYELDGKQYQCPTFEEGLEELMRQYRPLDAALHAPGARR